MRKVEHNFMTAIGALGLCALLLGCASSYKLTSSPDGTEVYHIKGSTKAFLGQTPLNFGKSGLPDNTPFQLRFEKPGFEPRDLLVTPNDDTTTTINVNLKPGLVAESDEALKRTRTVVKQIFAVQEYVFNKRYVDALAALSQLEQREPNLPEIFVLRGSVYLLLNDKTNAKKQWEQAVKLDPQLDAIKHRIAELDATEDKR